MNKNLKKNMKIEEIDYRNNAFDILKLIGAFIVLFSHSFRHFNVTKPVYTLFFTDGATGVVIFFAITGFVMMPTWEKMQGKKHSYIKFMFNRFMRLYPALWLSFVIISIANTLIMNINIFSVDYLLYSIRYCIFAKGNGYGLNGITNGVLWTILPDIVFYFITPLVYKIMKNQKTWVWLVVIILFWQFNVWDAKVIAVCQKIPFFGLFVSETFSLCFMYEFLIGSFLYFKRNTILKFFVNHKTYAYVWLSIFTVFFVLYNSFNFIPKRGLMHTPWMGIMVAPLAIILAFVIGKFRIKKELSYSIFLFHMIIVQILKFFSISGYLGILLTLLITPIVALLSRLCVEEPFFKLKIGTKKDK